MYRDNYHEIDTGGIIFREIKEGTMRLIVRMLGPVAVLMLSTVPVKAIDWYAGVGAGSFSFDVSIPAVPITGSGSAGGGFIILGGDFNEYIGAELRLGGTGDALLSTLGTNYSFAAFASIFLKPQFNFATPSGPRIYGLLGVTNGNIQTTLGLDQTESGLSYGAGIEYELVPQWWIGGEFVRYWDAVTVLGVADITVDGVSGFVKYYF